MHLFISFIQGNALSNGPQVTSHDASLQNQVEYDINLLITHLMSLGCSEVSINYKNPTEKIR